MAAAVWRRPKSIWETCQGWESPIVGRLLHASSRPAGESMSPRGRPVPAVRSCNFCGCCLEPTMCSTYLVALSPLAAILKIDCTLRIMNHANQFRAVKRQGSRTRDGVGFFGIISPLPSPYPAPMTIRRPSLAGHSDRGARKWARLRGAIDCTISRGCSRVLWRAYAWFFLPDKLATLALI
jgi:hypothetical protein